MTKRPSLASSMKALAEDQAPAPIPAEVTPRPRTAPELESKPAATRAGMKRLLTPVAPSLHKKLKMLAVKQDMTLEAVTRAALEAYLLQHDSN